MDQPRPDGGGGGDGRVSSVLSAQSASAQRPRTSQGGGSGQPRHSDASEFEAILQRALAQGEADAFRGSSQLPRTPSRGGPEGEGSPAVLVEGAPSAVRAVEPRPAPVEAGSDVAQGRGEEGMGDGDGGDGGDPFTFRVDALPEWGDL